MKRLGPGLLADAWAIVTSAVICHSLLFGSGYGLGRDMVFTPREPLTWSAVGLGSSAPRAVPLDGLLALLTHVVDGEWVGRFAVFGVLAVAGCGAHRIGRSWRTPARVATAGFAVWNPFVVERLALGQWALLAAYAALPWLIVAIDRYLAGPPDLRRLTPVTGWLALASITPTGGVVAVGLALALGVRRRGALLLAGIVTALQLPWLLAALVGSATSTSDPAAVAAFASRSERPGGPAMSLLGLGGIWDAGSTPGSRGGPLGYLTSAAVVVALVSGWPVLHRTLRSSAVRLAVFAAIGFGLALVSVLPGGRELMNWVVREVPGGGLFRDAQKWLLPFVLLSVLSFGALVHRVTEAVRTTEAAALVAVAAAAVPVLLLPDALATVDRTLSPSSYPPDFAAVARIVDGRGAMVTLPFESYRRFSWATGVSVADPASRWFDTDVVTSDELVVGDVRLSGEDPRAGRIAAALRAGRPLPHVLADNGVRWALLYLDAPRAGAVSTNGLEPAYRGRYLALYRVPGPTTESGDAAVGTAAAWIVGSVDLVLLVVVVAAVGWAATLQHKAGRG